MLVISVNGVFRNKKYFYYVTKEEDNTIRFNNNIDKALIFNSLDEAMTFARDHYLELLNIMASGSAKMLTKTLAVRKMVFKVVRDIDENILNYEGREINESAENTDALNETSDNGSEPESGMEEEMSYDEAEASSSDLQENPEE